jgi:D-amino peptidase
MNVYIQADFEGIAGMIEWDDYVTDSPMNQEKRARLRRILTSEVNAAAEGSFAGGADKVLIWDSHGPSNNCNNIYFEDLNPEVEIIIGWKGLPSFYPLLDSTFSAGIYIGGHAMQGSVKAILPHTKTNLNGTDYGEVGMFGIMCGWFGFPLIFVSGDKATVDEIKQISPKLEYVVTKESFSPYAAKTLVPEKAREMIRVGTEKALKRIKEIEPIKIPSPFVIKTETNQFAGKDLSLLFNSYVDPGNEIFGNQDVNPERARVLKKREIWDKEISFLVPPEEGT